MILLKKWDKLPETIKNDKVREYYETLSKKRISIFLKRLFDIFFSLLFILVFSPVYLIIALIVLIDDGYPIIYKQERVTTNAKRFRVFKFRTMVKNADKIGTLVTVNNDNRITKSGNFLRKYRLDELPQIFNILFGSMSFVGTRPEVVEYVNEYTDEMMATLLLPAGVTSTASINYKDEAELLNDCEDVFHTYTKEVLPEKMKFNLQYLKEFNILNDIKIIINTIIAVFK